MSSNLMVTEQRDLARCEEAIEKGMTTFVEVGQALARIRDGKLYRDSHGTFAAYVKDRWDRSRKWADLTIESANVTSRIENENNCSQMPANEAQARALSKAPPEQQPELWEQVVEEHGEDVTAAKVRDAVAKSAKAVAPEKPAKNGREVTAAADRKKLNDCFGAIQRFIDDASIRTPEIDRSMQAIWEAIAR